MSKRDRASSDAGGVAQPQAKRLAPQPTEGDQVAALPGPQSQSQSQPQPQPQPQPPLPDEPMPGGFRVCAPEFQAEHESWEAFDEALKAYAQATYQLYVIRSTTSVKRRNLKILETAAAATSGSTNSNNGVAPAVAMDGQAGTEDAATAAAVTLATTDSDTALMTERGLIPERFQWYSKSLKCTHGWKDRHRGTGKRGSGVVRSTSCPAKMCVTLRRCEASPGGWKVMVTKHEREHNHQLSKELYLYYAENRRIYDPELLAVVGDATASSTTTPSTAANTSTSAAQGGSAAALVTLPHDANIEQLTSLLAQENQERSRLYHLLSSSGHEAVVQQTSAALALPGASHATGTDTTNKSTVGLADGRNGSFYLRQQGMADTLTSSVSPPVASVLTAGTMPPTAVAGGIFRAPRVAVKVHASWDAFHSYVAQYSFDTAQVFRTRSTVSVAARNAKLMGTAAAKAAETGSHEVASYASYSASSPSTRLIPEEAKWYSKLLICTHGWKRKSRSKGSRFMEDNGGREGGEPCPAMMLARVERHVDGEWRVVINRQVQEHNHRLTTQGDKSGPGINLVPTLPSTGPSVTTAKAPASALSAVETPAAHAEQVNPAEALPVPVATTEEAGEAGTETATLASSEQHEVVVRVAKLPTEFASWDDFHASLKAYSDATYQLYRTRTTSSAKGRNQKIAEMWQNTEGGDGEESTGEMRMIPESWRWYSKTLTCTHGWKERHRGTGKRTAHVVRSTACPVKICATVQYGKPASSVGGVAAARSASGAAVEGSSDKAPTQSDSNASLESGCCWRVVVTKQVVDHNHNLSKELYQHYCENRRIYDPELLTIDESNESAIVLPKTQRGHPAPVAANAIPAGLPDPSGQVNSGLPMSSRPLVLNTKIDTEVASPVQAPASSGDSHPVVIGVDTSGQMTGFQSTPASSSVAVSVSMDGTQHSVPSMVLLPYGVNSYAAIPAQSQSMQQQGVSAQTGALADNSAGLPTGATTVAMPGGGVATLATMAAPGLSSGNLVVLNNATMATTGVIPQTGTNVVSLSCRVHGPQATESTAPASATNPQASGVSTAGATSGGATDGAGDSSTQPQCTCFRIAGGGNYVTIVPATTSRLPGGTNLDADDSALLYTEDMEGVWTASAPAPEIERVKTEKGDIVWRAPRIARRYPSWEAFHQNLEAYSAATFQLYRVRTTYSVRSRNVRLRQLAASRGLTVRPGNRTDQINATDETGGEPQPPASGEALSRAHLVPEHFEWYSKTFLCTHGWKRRSRGSGQRVSHTMRATECPAKVCATLQRVDAGATARWSVVITKHVTEHNHELSGAVYQQYVENRRVRDPKALAEAEQLWRSGASRRRVFEFLKEQAPTHIILMKDVHNLVARWQAQERRQPPAPAQQQGDHTVNVDGSGNQEQQSVAAVVPAASDEDPRWLA